MQSAVEFCEHREHFSFATDVKRFVLALAHKAQFRQYLRGFARYWRIVAKTVYSVQVLSRAPPPKANKTTTKKPTTKSERKESKFAFIDRLLEKGAMTMEAIAKAATKKFNCDYVKTLATCRCRPTHMRKAGRKPQWITEEAPAK